MTLTGQVIMTRARKVAITVLLLLLAVVILRVAVPLLVDVDHYRPEVVAEIEQKTGHPARIGHLALTFTPLLSIRADDFVLGNPGGFPPGDCISAKSIYAVLDAGALWHRQVIITSFMLSKPVITLVSNSRDQWNFDVPARPQADTPRDEPSSSSSSSFSLGAINRSEVEHGQVTIASLLPSGQIGPPSFVARDVSLKFDQADLGAFLAPDHQSAHMAPIEGTLKAASLSIGRLEGTSVKSGLSLDSRRISFKDLSFKVYSGRGSGNLVINFKHQPASYTADARLSGVNMASVLEAFPSAEGKMSGRLDGRLKLEGQFIQSNDPLAGKTGQGEVAVRDGRLPSLKLNQNLMLLANFADLGPASGDPSSFRSLSADLTIGQGRIHSNHIVLNGNGVDVDMAGDIAFAGAGALEYSGMAKIRASQNAISNVVAGLAGATFSNGMLTFPFSLTGTPDAPRFRLRNPLGGLNQMSKGSGGTPNLNPQNPAGLFNTLQDLLKKKNPK